MAFLANARECGDPSARCQPNGSRLIAAILFVLAGCDSCTPARVTPAPAAEPAAAAEEGAERERLTAYRDEVLRREEEERVASGRTECESAFEYTRDLARTVGAEETALPARQDFMRDCDSLPLAVKRCMVPSYSMSHAAECREVRQGLSPELRERVRRLTGAPVP
jgi:hypothetical protein